MNIQSQYARFGTDTGGAVEITLRPARVGTPAKQEIKITTPTGQEMVLDHPKDVSGFLEMPISQLLLTVDKLVADSLQEAREASAARAAKVRAAGGRGGRVLELV